MGPGDDTGRYAPLTPGVDRPATVRLPAIDLLRGAALCGMIVFHAAWDLADRGYLSQSPGASTGWRLFGHAVAAVFLALSGYALVLAVPRGTRFALVRIARIAAAALVVTAVTAWLFPGQAITFGILHCIALGNLLVLPLRRASPLVLLPLAAMAVMLPLGWSGSTLDGPWWSWLGLGDTPPETLDFRPLLPWIAATILGVAAARLPKPGRAPHGAGWRLLEVAGRHSLWVYLVHQPVLIGLVALATILSPPPILAGRNPFVRACVDQCVAAGAGKPACETACRCVDSRLQLGTTPDDAVLRRDASECLASRSR